MLDEWRGVYGICVDNGMMRYVTEVDAGSSISSIG